MTGVPIDPVTSRLGGLTSIDPDAVHSAAVRARCQAVLARQRRSREAGAGAPAVGARRFELALACSFSLIYLTGVIRNALAFYLAL